MAEPFKSESRSVADTPKAANGGADVLGIRDTRRMPEDALFASVQNRHYVAACRRIFRQLVEALVYEGVVRPQTEELADGSLRLTICGIHESGDDVLYVCEARRRPSFGRIRLSDQPVVRVHGGAESEAADPPLFMAEIAPLLEQRPTRLRSFAQELQQTLANDAAALAYRDAALAGQSSGVRSCDDLEGDVIDGHLYHPCYKSRIGFDWRDNRAYGPEFHPRFTLVWLAVRERLVDVAAGAELATERRQEFAAEWSQERTSGRLQELAAEQQWRELVRQQLGADEYERFAGMIRERGGHEAEYVYIPVHPWQWREQSLSLYFRYIASGDIIPLGEGGDAYSPQQSIRTLANRAASRKLTVKLSLGIVNTSSLRTISARHARSGPIVSGRLGEMVAGDPYLRDELRLVLLKEQLGVSFRYELLPEPVRNAAAGTLGALWRDSVNGFLQEDEQAAPFTALTQIGLDGEPFIAPWIGWAGGDDGSRAGEAAAVAWLEKLLPVAMYPIIHLMYAHGAAVEAHAQNMLLIHKRGVPERIAVRDFSGGVLLYVEDGAHPALPETTRREEVRDVVHNSLFFVHLAELALLLERHYGMDERRFWRMTADVIAGYQLRFPELAAQFAAYDLFAPHVEVGQLAKRRLMDASAGRDHFVANPLSGLDDAAEKDKDSEAKAADRGSTVRAACAGTIARVEGSVWS